MRHNCDPAYLAHDAFFSHRNGKKAGDYPAFLWALPSVPQRHRLVHGMRLPMSTFNPRITA
jgi:hypothetical protein